MSSANNNLDRLAAQTAQNIIANTKSKSPSEIENTITKSLGVLQEDGVYACFLYLLAREKDNGKAVVKEMLELLEQLNFGWEKPKQNGKVDLRPDIVLPHITDRVTQNLERLLLAKEVLEQMLIYARYGAKARGTYEKNLNPNNEDNQNPGDNKAEESS